MISLPFTLAEPENFALWEKLLLAALILASALLFWRRFGVVLDRILKSKKDPGFHLGNVGRRVWRFVSEVLLQSKVIQQRPFPPSWRSFQERHLSHNTFKTQKKPALPAFLNAAAAAVPRASPRR